MSMDFLKLYIEKYFNNIENRVKEYYEFAEKVRSLGYDPEPFVEMPPAEDLAARVEGLVGPKGIANFIRDLEEEYGESTDKIIMEVIDAILDGKFGDFEGDLEKKIEQALRTAAAIETNAVVSAPIEGIAYVKIKQNKDGSKYLAVYFAGPIRGAGGTAAAKIVVFADYIRKKVGLGRYKPTEEQIRRYLEERELVHNWLARLQYYPKDKEMRTILENCPVEVNGEPTGNKEVEVTKDVEGIETNKLRQSVHLVLCEGVALKAPKVMDAAERYGLDWSWLDELINKGSEEKKGEKEEKEANIWEKINPNDKYLQEIAGGRAILSYPSKIGGFRIRYGRSRNNGIMAKNIHPCAMILSDDFIAIGTQLKVERSGKAMAAVPCDTIEAPIVKLKNGDVIRVDDIDLAKRLMENDEIERILFLGDVLITFGDFKKKKDLIAPAGYCEEWWKVELEEKYGLKVDNPFNVSLEDALYYSKEIKAPLHPKYLPFFDNLNINELKELSKFVRSGELDGNVLILDKEVKPILEKAFVLHKYRDNKCYVDYGIVLYEIFRNDKEEIKEKDIIKYLNLISPFPIRPKAGTYMGARMGRPEKAKERTMKPPVHGLFPIGKYGGKTRYILKAAKNAEIVDVEIKYMFCEKCNKIVPAYKCPYCGSKTEKVNVCPKCGNKTQNEICESCGTKTESYGKQYINLKDLLKTIYNFRIPDKTKGVEGLFNKSKFFEPIEKVVLRAKHSVYVFRDGTIRFDAIDIPLTHFKPKEIGVSVEKLKELGYEFDVFGKPLENEDQILLLYPQDIVIPYHAAEYMLKVSRFIDDLLDEYYGIERFYNFKSIDDLVGELVIALAPHTSSGIVGRIIGFTKANGIYAHSFFHASKRRNADGDEDSIMLLLDGLINFSKNYLPNSRGGFMDASLVLRTILKVEEADDECWEMETCEGKPFYVYPLKFYEKTWMGLDPKQFKKEVGLEIVEDVLKEGLKPYLLGFTHDLTNINDGSHVSLYKRLKTMLEKVERSLKLAEKIDAVDVRDAAEKIINLHFIRDLYGNLKSFGTQKFRCVNCNETFRRVPLIGRCPKCGGKLVLTVTKGGIVKYLEVSQKMAEKYQLNPYIRQRLKIFEKDVNTIFKEEKDPGQKTLADFFNR